MKHLFILLITCAAFAGTVAAQKAGAVHQAIKDPKREVNAGKADVYIHDKHQVSDTSTKAKKTMAVEKKRKRKCGTRSNAS